MADDGDVLEQLRRSLARMETRQRASGGTAEPGFWGASVNAAAGDADEAASGSSREPHRRRPRRLAPRSRPAKPPTGPWADLTAGARDSLLSAEVGWTSEAESEDPGWVAAVAARAEEAHAAQSSHSAEGARVADPADAVESGPPVGVTAEALIGVSLHSHPETELGHAAEWIAAQRAGHEVMLVNVIAELESRGAQSPGGLTRTDWLRSLDPTLSAAAARAFVRVGRAVTEPRWAELRQLVTTQQVTVAAAAQIVEFEQRNHPVADPDELGAAIDDVTTQAQALRPEELAVLIRHHTEQVRPPKDDQALEEGRRQARGLWFGQPTATGMVTMRGVLDPEAAAVIKSAVDPLSVPCPTKDGHGHIVDPDLRTPAKRRADALLEIVARGVSAPEGVATTDKAKVVVLIDHDTLTGQVRGTGRTLSGDVLSAEDVRRLACDAGIIPVVLGAHGEPLDVGRERRLVTKGLRLALITRDRGCSFPGCTMPPQWTDAHHVTHWSRGGHTSLTTTALLCRRHHTHVHRHDLTATVSATTVTWHV